MKAEQKWQLSCSLTWAIAAPVSPLYVCILLRLREIIVHGQDWWMEKDKTLQLRRREEKKHTSWHTIKCILSSCSEGGGSGWVLTIRTMKTIKSRRNTGEISFQQRLWRRGSVHTCTREHAESPAPAHVSAIMTGMITIMSGTSFYPHLSFWAFVSQWQLVSLPSANPLLTGKGLVTRVTLESLGML